MRNMGFLQLITFYIPIAEYYFVEREKLLNEIGV